MIKQTATGLNSKSESNPYNKDGFLPLITAPMYSVVDENNYQIFLDNKIQVCLPRGNKNRDNFVTTYPLFISMSLQDFISEYVDSQDEIRENVTFAHKICIDTANGNMPSLHDAIKKAKEIHGYKLVIMAGNVASVKAFVELAKAGCDYIRVGINESVTKNTGVGVKDLAKLVKKCAEIVKYCRVYEEIGQIKSEWFYDYQDSLGFHSQEAADNLKKVKIVADNIYPYIKQCELKYGFNINGYAAINKLLFSGADLVMLDANVTRLGLEEWLKGSDNSINYPFLTGWIDSLKEAMAHTNKPEL